MAFSQTTISNVRVSRNGPEVFVAWNCSAATGSVFQVYLDRRLSWSGTALSCTVPAPADALGRNAWVEIGTVASAEAHTDFSASLVGPAGQGGRVSLAWLGGTYLDATLRDDIQGFQIFRSASAGGPVDFSTSLGVVAAYPGDVISDGFGVGGFGKGGFGKAATSYQWFGSPLDSGVWSFAVAPYDLAGNVQAAPSVVTVAIATPPRAPAADANGLRLSYSYAGPATAVATLNWLASPSADR